MATKVQTISARIPQEDVEFIAGLEIAGARTSSDKLRAIIQETRFRHEGVNDYEDAINVMQDLLFPISRKLSGFEANTDVHSELLARVFDWLPDMVAYLVDKGAVIDSDNSINLTQAMELGTTKRVFRLLESVLQIAIATDCACYDREVIRTEIKSVAELSKLINQLHFTENGD